MTPSFSKTLREIANYVDDFRNDLANNKTPLMDMCAALELFAEDLRDDADYLDAQDSPKILCQDTDTRPTVDRNAVLEEAAKVADAIADERSKEWRDGLKGNIYLEGQMDGADDVAQAIRALKEPT